MKPLVVDLPYPTLDGIEKNQKIAREIACAYTGFHSEMTAILQYVYHAFFFNKLGQNDTADLLESIAIAEMQHLDVLGKLLIKLGEDPIFAIKSPCGYDFYSTASVTYSKTPQKMLLDDISGELLAIKQYEKIISNVFDEQVASIITRIKLDEELHVLALKKQLDKICN